MTRLKLICAANEPHPDQTPPGARLAFHAATEGPENEAWRQATPCASLTVDVSPEVAKQYTPGGVYFADLQPAS